MDALFWASGFVQVLKVLEFDFLKQKSWKPLENRHIYEKVLKKCMNY